MVDGFDHLHLFVLFKEDAVAARERNRPSQASCQSKSRALRLSARALKNGWLEDVKVVFFGPFEQLVLQDEQVGTLRAARPSRRAGGE